MSDTRDEDLERVRDAVRVLTEHFDTAHVFCSRHDPGDDKTTLTVQLGSGHWYALRPDQNLDHPLRRGIAHRGQGRNERLNYEHPRQAPNPTVRSTSFPMSRRTHRMQPSAGHDAPPVLRGARDDG